MSQVWQRLEELADGLHPAGEWAGEALSAYLKPTQQQARWLPCPHGCGCRHEVFERGPDELVAVCRCEPRDCNDIILAPDIVRLWEFNAGKFGRAVARAFDCDARHTPLPLPMTWQIGAKFATAVPVFLTIQNEREGFRRVVGELVARQRQPFILLTPTNRRWDATSRELLAGAKAGCFDLESHLVLLPSGVLQARMSGGELFAAFQPTAIQPTDEEQARRVFALIEKLEAGPRAKKPSVMDVFRLYCIKGKTTDQIVDLCKTSKGTVINRLESIRRATNTDPDELRAFSPYIQRMEESLTDARAEYIHRKTLVHDVPDEDDEKG